MRIHYPNPTMGLPARITIGGWFRDASLITSVTGEETLIATGPVTLFEKKARRRKMQQSPNAYPGADGVP